MPLYGTGRYASPNNNLPNHPKTIKLIGTVLPVPNGSSSGRAVLSVAQRCLGPVIGLAKRVQEQRSITVFHVTGE